jgi:hypothetical protein
MVQYKIAEPARKLRLINYKLAFHREDKVSVFIGDVLKMKEEGADYVVAELNPLVFVHIPKFYVAVSR